MRLEEIKNEYAKSYGYNNWDDYVDGMSARDRELELNDIAKLYAKECIEASLKYASDNAQAYGGSEFLIKKESIDNKLNIILL